MSYAAKISDRTMERIEDALADRWLTMRELQAETGLSASTIGHALGVHPLADWRPNQCGKVGSPAKQWTIIRKDEK